jgi:hypothetical protein
MAQQRSFSMSEADCSALLFPTSPSASVNAPRSALPPPQVQCDLLKVAAGRTPVLVSFSEPLAAAELFEPSVTKWELKQPHMRSRQSCYRRGRRPERETPIAPRSAPPRALWRTQVRVRVLMVAPHTLRIRTPRRRCKCCAPRDSGLGRARRRGCSLRGRHERIFRV